VTTSLLASLREQLGDRYAFERELGRGGMGAVYLARDRKLDRLVALKVLPPEYATDAGLRERFLRETRMVAGFSHPNIVPVFAVEETPTLLAFAMGFVEGESLGARVARAGPLTEREAVRLLQDIGYALAYAHGRGVVHRDLKPDNIMIERASGRALLMDFGIARTIEAPAANNGLTRVGEVVGTPEFMSPEQATGDVVDGRSDLYSLALVTYFALTGQFAISGESTQRIIIKQLTDAVPSIGVLRPDLTASLVTVLDRCACKEPAARFPSAEALVEALEASQLAAPEVSVPVREFAAELESAPLMLVIALIIIDFILDLNAARGWSLSDGLMTVMLVLAVVTARLSHTGSTYKRLRSLGFDGEAIRSQFRQIGEERAGYRATLRAQPRHRRRERLLFWSGVLMIPAAVLLMKAALASRTKLGPDYYQVPVWASIAFVAINVMIGTAIVLILRNPMGTPLPERLFRLLWLGPLGRWLFSGTNPSGSRTLPPTQPPTQPITRPSPRPITRPSPPPLSTASTALPHARQTSAEPLDDDVRETVRALETRVRLLEQRAARDSDSLHLGA
jgi:hypothetical protein